MALGTAGSNPSRLGLLFWAFHYRSFLWGQVCNIFGICTDKHWIRSVLKDAGPLAPLVFIVIQALQVVFAPIPGEATGFIGGYLFGAPLGLLYSTLGLTLGSVGSFYCPLAGGTLRQAVDSGGNPAEVRLSDGTPGGPGSRSSSSSCPAFPKTTSVSSWA